MKDTADLLLFEKAFLYATGTSRVIRSHPQSRNRNSFTNLYYVTTYPIDRVWVDGRFVHTVGKIQAVYGIWFTFESAAGCSG